MRGSSQVQPTGLGQNSGPDGKQPLILRRVEDEVGHGQITGVDPNAAKTWFRMIDVSSRDGLFERG